MSESVEPSMEANEILDESEKTDLNGGLASTNHLNRESIIANDENVNCQEDTPSPDRDTEDIVAEVCQNPEPPKELAGLIDADNIGGTVFSKHWLFTTLMKLLEVN